jgi:hypothetical protein
MILCFDVPRDAKDALDRLMATAAYRDVSEAVAAALISYESITKAGLAGAVPTIPRQAEAPSGAPSAAGTPSTQAGLEPTAAVSLFALSQSKSDDRNGPAVSAVPFEDVPPTGWLFGQYNKLLPLKASCRAMLNLLHEYREGVPLREAANRIADAASLLGERLRQMDRASERQREDAFAAAFPSAGPADVGSRIRFANQFVGDFRQSPRSSNSIQPPRFNSMPGALKLAVCTGAKSPVVELTAPGREFASLPNPALDKSGPPIGGKLSGEEIAFLVGHISAAVPEEASAIYSVLQGVTQGADTPAGIDEFICSKYELTVTDVPQNQKEITRTFLTTQRTGAISRMIDLALLTRIKSGLYVRYTVSDSGKALLKQFS